MLNSHKNFIKRHESILSGYFILENEVGTDPLDNIEPSEVISLGVCRSELSVSTLKNWFHCFTRFLTLSSPCSVTMT